MKYLVIGLGNFGTALAEELTAGGHDVIGVDTCEQRIEDVKERIAVAYILDATDAEALKSLPLAQLDVVFVAIGHSLSASLRTVAALKKLGTRSLYVRAIDAVHLSILEAMSIENVFMPESYAARLFVQKILKGV